MQIPFAQTAYSKAFWLRWFIWTVISIALSLLLFMMGVGEFINHWNPLYFGVAVGAVFGLFSGTAQAVLLKKYMQQPARWIIATGAGWICFWSLNMAGYFGRGTGLQEKIAEGFIHGLVFGLMVGFPQSLCFANNRMRIQWLVSNLIIWPVSAVAADSLRTAFGLNGPAEFIIAFPMSALLSGIAMNRLLINP